MNKKFRWYLLAACVSAAFTLTAGCNATERARSMSLNKYSGYHIVQYSGGKKIGEWDSTARPSSEEYSDGYSFVDTKTSELFLISGDVQITENKDK